MPSSGVDPPGETGSDIMPEWMSCDLVAYNILQEVSNQIVSHCESFGKHLEGVCGQAIERLPPSDGTDPFDCSDACINFISAFGALSHELLQLAGDVDCSVKKPLQGIILSLTEERAGRMNHWKQVKNRFAELQERYRRSRLRSIEARTKLTSSSGSKSHWFKSRPDAGQAATEQHAAMCDLAECEEELRESEASLRRLEEENKEILRKLDREKQADLRGFLAKGTSSLRRLVSVTDKALANETVPESSSTSGPKPASPTSWAGVLPSRVPNAEKVNEKEDGQESGDKTDDGCERPPESVVPQPPIQEAIPDPSESNLASTDPSAKYLQGTGASPFGIGGGLDISELTDSDDGEEASTRAASWTPAKDSPLAKGKTKRQSFVFQSSGGSSLLGGDMRPVTRKSSPQILSSPSNTKVSSPEHPSVKTALSLSNIRAIPVEQGVEDSAAAQIRPLALPFQEAASSNPIARPSVTSVASESANEIQPSPPRRKVAVVDDSSEDDGEESSSPSRSGPKPPLERAELKLDVVPLVVEAEKLQKYFERYLQRVSETLQTASEASWSRLQERANEQCLGGHVGKLELFWICRPGTEPTPESASGLVCFQFVQGFASNFARILHLSVVGQGSSAGKVDNARDQWPSLLPSAIFEIRRLIFETLPVQSIRAVVLMGEDESGNLCVDGDVEAAYQRCRFRWFQLTQNLRRSRSGIRRKHKVRPSTRFMVLHAPRLEIDPNPPRQSSIQPMPAMLLRDGPSSADSTLPVVDRVEGGGDSKFSAW